MVELFAGYSLAQIVIFIIVLALAAKEGITLFEFFYSRSKNHFDGEFTEEQEKEDMKKDIMALQDTLNAHEQKFNNINETLKDFKNFCQRSFDKQEETMNLLISSDRDDIKSFIVREYHYFTEQKGWIDDFSLDAIEKRYAHYVAEGGNTYVHTLMDELRALPKHAPKNK